MASILIGVVLYKNTQLQLEKLLRSIAVQSCKNIDVKIHLRSNDMSDYDKELKSILNRNLDLNNLHTVGFTVGENIGFGAAHNSLARIAKDQQYDLYLGLNPDGMLHHRALEELCAVARTNPENALLELRQFPEEHPKTYDCLTGQTQWCSGAAFAINPRFFSSIGGFDEKIFMYCEDVDLSWRVRATGGNCLVAYKSLFFHDLSDKRASTRVRLQMLSSGRYLGWKWHIPELQDLCERELVGTGLYQDYTNLPPIEGTKVQFEPDLIERICDHRSAFSFSTVRW